MFHVVSVTIEHCRLVPSDSSSGFCFLAKIAALSFAVPCSFSLTPKAFQVFIFALHGGLEKILRHNYEHNSNSRA